MRPFDALLVEKKAYCIYTLFLFFQELETIRARVQEMEEEAQKLKMIQTVVDHRMTSGTTTTSNVTTSTSVAGGGKFYTL